MAELNYVPRGGPGLKLLVLSDLHVEFAPFVPNQAALDAADVVILGGDIHVGVRGMEWAATTFAGKPIIYVAGNHEFYKHDWDNLLDELREAAKRFGIHFLENESVTIAGVRFLGASLWTDFDFYGESRRTQAMQRAEDALNDYKLITAKPLLGDLAPSQVIEPPVDTTSRDHMRVAVHRREPVPGFLTPPHTIARHTESRAWLKAELALGEPARTVVVTHHYTHHFSTAPRFLLAPVTAAFGSRLPLDLIKSASLWIHGHVHDSYNYSIGDAPNEVRIICNPRGYPLDRRAMVYENADFDPALIVEIDNSPLAGHTVTRRRIHMGQRDQANGAIFFCGDTHGRFDHVIDAVWKHEPAAVLFLGDLQAQRPLQEELRAILDDTEITFIHGNHDTDSDQDYDNLFGSTLAPRNLHGKVTEVAGVRIAGLGGVFRGQIWSPPSDPLFKSPKEVMRSLGNGNLWRGGLPRKHHSSIFPVDYLGLAGKRADVLITHEAPSVHPYGWEAIDKLAVSMRVQKTFHGHQHDSLDYSMHWKALGFQAYGVGFCGITALDGTVIRVGDYDTVRNGRGDY